MPFKESPEGQTHYDPVEEARMQARKEGIKEGLEMVENDVFKLKSHSGWNKWEHHILEMVLKIIRDFRQKINEV